MKTDPIYAEQWWGVGRTIRLTLEHRVQLYACSHCAALVLDQGAHTDFHRRAEG